MSAPTMRNSVETAPFQWPNTSTQGLAQFYDITLPTYVVGDLVVIHLHLFSGTTGPPNPPSGWTQQDTNRVAGSGTPAMTLTYTRVMDGSEGSTVRVFGVGTIQNKWSWHAVASSWQDVASISAVGGGSSNSNNVATWTLGTLSGGFTTASFTNLAQWGGQYLRLASTDLYSYTDIGTLTMVHGQDSKDITTAFAADYDLQDTSGLIVSAFSYARLILVRDAQNLAPQVTSHMDRIWYRPA